MDQEVIDNEFKDEEAEKAHIDDQSPNPFARDFVNEELDEPDVEDSKKEIETETPAGFKVDNTVLETDDDLEELLEQADEETLEEVAKELEKEEPKINLNRIRDLTIPDTDLSPEELKQRKVQFPEGYDGKLIDTTPLQQKYEKIIKDE